MPGTAVFICDCMGLISETVDMASLQALAETFEEAVVVRRMGLLCGRAELDEMVDVIRRSGADRLLFAGCSPRSSLKLPEEKLLSVAARAGLDPSAVEVANIREGCAWVHGRDPASASRKARDLLRMARVRLQGSDPPAATVPLEPRVLVLGGGAAGLAAAKALGRVGVETVLVEQQPYLGGTLCQLPFIYQSEGWPAQCESRCVGPVQALEAQNAPGTTVLTEAEVAGLQTSGGNFEARIALAPRFVDADRCMACGQCEAVCPEVTHNPFELRTRPRKAIAKDFERAVPDAFSLVEQACTRCGLCVEVCPTHAIDLLARPTTLDLKAGAVIVAAGSRERDPQASPELGSGLPGVVTALGLERLIASGLKQPGGQGPPERVVFVQCAGSRAGLDKQGSGVPYCSRTCCAVTAKQVKRLSLMAPQTEVEVLYYRDFRTYERALEKLYQDLVAMGIEFRNGEVTAVEQGSEGHGLLVRYDRLGCEEIEDKSASLEADLVVLACAQEPRLPRAIRDLGFPLDIFGYPIENQPRLLRPGETFMDRVFVAGTARGPKGIQPSVSDGLAAAHLAFQALAPGAKKPPKHASHVDPERCSRCGICISVCPHGAIRMTEQGAVVDEAFCQACGMCAASCASHAAVLRSFSEQRLLAEAEAAFTELPPEEPRLLALLCYWCSYGGADLAGVERLELPPQVRPLRVRCSCSVNLGVVVELFRRGIDGVFLGGCPENSCHHMWGNWLSHKRTAMMKGLLAQMGLAEGRFKYDVIGIPHAHKYVEEMEKMVSELRRLGPNPWRRPRGEDAAAEVPWLGR